MASASASSSSNGREEPLGPAPLPTGNVVPLRRRPPPSDPAGALDDDSPTLIDPSLPIALAAATRDAAFAPFRPTAPWAQGSAAACASAGPEVVAILPPGRGLHLTASILSTCAILAALAALLHFHAVDTRVRRAAHEQRARSIRAAEAVPSAAGAPTAAGAAHP